MIQPHSKKSDISTKFIQGQVSVTFQ